ncbi:hypothetical protein F5X99DRAFT_152338 [Biscogniauxia marginata]|nr:hypothetical protein F5X99DRAFT_152338 [Biscogniauxia marginata]
MRFTAVSYVFLVATGVVSSPVTAPTEPNEPHQPQEFVSLWEEQLPNGGALEFLGPSPTDETTTPTRSLNVPRKACSANPQPSCDSSHAANNDLCSQLVNGLYGSSRSPVAKSPRQVCYKQDDSYCCTSWSSAVNGLTQGDLADNAQAILAQCAQNGVSGQLRGVRLKGVCLDQCLSNRGTGCT